MKTPSQKDKILKLLRTNGRVTRNEALSMFISRLGAIVCDLRKDGMDIEANYKDGDYIYTLKDKPKQVIEYRVQGQLVGTKTIW